MPALKRLELGHLLPDYTAPLISTDPNQRRIALRSLSQLIVDSANDAAYFMSHLDIPEGVISHFDLSRCCSFNREFQDCFIAFVTKAYENLTVDPRPRGLLSKTRFYLPSIMKFYVTLRRPYIIDTISSDCPFIFEFYYGSTYEVICEGDASNANYFTSLGTSGSQLVNSPTKTDH